MHALVFALVLGGCGAAFLALFWPGERHGRRLLIRWGVTHPTETAIGEAATYLRRRRIWYPWLFAGFGLVAGVLPGASRHAGLWGKAFAALLLGALIAEILAQWPSRGSRRVAVLAPRGVRTLVPDWALVCLVLAAATVTATGVSSLAGAGWARDVLPRQSAAGALAEAGLTAVIVLGVLALAVRRPAAGDPLVDAVLRLRSARVVTGMGIAVLASLSVSGGNLPALLITVAGVVAWRSVTAKPDAVPDAYPAAAR